MGWTSAMRDDSGNVPRHGEVWWVDLDPVRGHEQGRHRPGLVISVDEFNQLPHGLIWVVPVTGRLQRHSFAVEILPPEGGLSKRSVALCHHLRSVSVDRLDRVLGTVARSTSEDVLRRICLILGVTPRS
jgi:mRNA interferase MazF